MELLSYLRISVSSSDLAFPLIGNVMLLLHCGIGLVAARLAAHKGYDLGLWFAWGMVGGTLALLMACRLEAKRF